MSSPRRRSNRSTRGCRSARQRSWSRARALSSKLHAAFLQQLQVLTTKAIGMYQESVAMSEVNVQGMLTADQLFVREAAPSASCAGTGACEPLGAKACDLPKRRCWATGSLPSTSSRHQHLQPDAEPPPSCERGARGRSPRPRPRSAPRGEERVRAAANARARHGVASARAADDHDPQARPRQLSFAAADQARGQHRGGGDRHAAGEEGHADVVPHAVQPASAPRTRGSRAAGTRP